MNKEFSQLQWDAALIDDCRHLVRLGIREDLAQSYDLTTLALVPAERQGAARVVTRQAGVIAGVQAVPLILAEMQVPVEWHCATPDGSRAEPGTVVGRLVGPARDLLTAERLLLNMLGRLSGVATSTHRYVQAVAHTACRIYDTRKTTPGWRRLEKYAVRCGGGHNHRTGLFDAVLIKDNHLAQLAAAEGRPLSPAEAVRRARAFLENAAAGAAVAGVIVEIEVDTLEQLADVLPEAPDLVLLDNMSLDQMRTAVAQRDAAGVATQLEASGGITLDRISEIAATGIDRISVGALTHSAVSLDVGLDWED